MESIRSLLGATVLGCALIGCSPQLRSAQGLPDDTSSEKQAKESEGLEQISPEELKQHADETAAEFTLPEEAQADGARLEVLAKYGHLDPKRLIDDKLLEQAVLFYDANVHRIANRKILTVIDYSKRSTDARMFIVNLESGKVRALRVSHGAGSDPEKDGWANPDKFSNVEGSHATSLGFFLTAETYYGKHGYSLRLDGLSKTNSNARARAIVIHGATYVKEATVIQGRSWGCPAVAMEVRDEVVNTLKGGSLIYSGVSKVGLVPLALL